jgi:hypothetical protein
MVHALGGAFLFISTNCLQHIRLFVRLICIENVLLFSGEMPYVNEG